MASLILTLVCLLAFGLRVLTASVFNPARPPAAPLAVRSPYLNTWLNGRTDGEPSGYLAGQSPKFWSERVQTWQGFVLVDGQAYNWMGNATDASTADQEFLEYTSTRTTFVFNVEDKVQLNATFLSPVYYDDVRRQSITSSYLQVQALSVDGESHSVQVYCDVSGEWASGDDTALIQWESDSKDGVRYHKFYRQSQDVFSEVDEVASWGNWYWATEDDDGVTYQIGAYDDVRGQFLNSGNLTGGIDDDFRAVNDRIPVFAFSHNLSTVDSSSSSSKSALFTIGYTQEEAILFQGEEDEAQNLTSLWKEYFEEDELVTFFLNDFDHASEHSLQLDQRVAQDSVAAGGQNYLTITSLAVRQVFGALTYTNTTEQVLVFLKEISSNSDIQTVDLLYPAMPIFLYLNPELIRYTLDPLLENDRYQYPNKYAQHDLGTYPKALGHPDGDDEQMPLEESANMIIMMLAHAQATNQSAYLADNWDLLQNWAEYLIEDAKIPANQLSTDDFAGTLANQTNLAIKGIVALEAVAEIARLTNHTDEQANYTTTAHEYLDFWSEHGINNESDPKHSLLAYDNLTSYGLLYNIFPDSLLNLNLIPRSVYDMQSAFYLTVEQKYGVVLDTRGNLTKVDWELFAAAVAGSETKAMFIDKIATWINETTTWRAFGDLYDVETGGYSRDIEFTARPVVGAVFSLLVLDDGSPVVERSETKVAKGQKDRKLNSEEI